MALHSTLQALHALPSNAPQEPLALVTVGRCRSGPDLKIVWGSGRHGVDQCLQGLLEDMHFLGRRDKLPVQAKSVGLEISNIIQTIVSLFLENAILKESLDY